MWFGFSYSEYNEFNLQLTAVRVGKSDWVYSNWWTLRLWPVRLDGKILPEWYTNIWLKCGYNMEYKE